MELNEDEKQFGNVITLLKNLKKIEAPDNFTSDLFGKINSEAYRNLKPEINKFSIRSKYIPAMALGSIVILIFIIINLNQGSSYNPLLTDPKVREDIITSTNITKGQPESDDQIINDFNMKKETTGIEKPKSEKNRLLVPSGKGNIAGKQTSPSTNLDKAGVNPKLTGRMSAALQNETTISRVGLNFRQVNIVQSERIKVMELKHKMEMSFRRTNPAIK